MTDNWQEITVRKPGLGPSSLGQGRLDKKGREVPLGPGESNKAKHGRCVDHVEVPGVPGKVCILRGQDRDLIIAEARELAGDE